MCVLTPSESRVTFPQCVEINIVDTDGALPDGGGDDTKPLRVQPLRHHARGLVLVQRPVIEETQTQTNKINLIEPRESK